MTDRNGTPVLPGSVVFEVGAFLSPGIVLADGVSVIFLPCADVPELLIWPLVAGETPDVDTEGDPVAFASYDLVVVDPADVDWGSYYPF
jgi:hypothetical protein